MEHFWLQMIGTGIISILGGLGLMKVFISGKSRNEVWSLYEELSDEMELQRSEGSTANYGLPDLSGEKEGRKIYIHPVRGKKKQPPKTIYGVEHDFTVEGDIIVTSPETSSLEKELPELDIPSLKKYDYQVVTENHKNEDMANKIFSRKAASKLNRMISRAGDDFRALIIESGLVMFSTYGIKDDGEQIKERSSDLIDLVEEMEESSGIEGGTPSNERIEKIAEKSRTVYLEVGMMGALLAVSAYLFINVMSNFSIFFLSLAIIMALIAGTRLGSIMWTRGWV